MLRGHSICALEHPFNVLSNIPQAHTKIKFQLYRGWETKMVTVIFM